MTYSIIIDRSACSGFGSCVQESGGLFELGADGVATAPAQTSAGAAALAAARACPMGAIVVLDEAGKEQR